MNFVTFIIFGLLQICLVYGQGAAVAVDAFGATPSSIGAASAKAVGDKANGAAQVIAGPGFVSSTATASASSKKHHKPPPKKHHAPPPKKHTPPPKKHTPPPKKHTPPPKKHAPPPPKKHSWTFPKITFPKFGKKD